MAPLALVAVDSAPRIEERDVTDEPLPETRSGTITRILSELRRGDPGAEQALFELVQDELQRVARALMHRQPVGHTLQPTALVNEAYMRLLGAGPTDFADRDHFLRTAARAMRSILVDHARRRLADKRGGDRAQVVLKDDVAAEVPDGEIVAVNEALGRLEAVQPRAARVVELRFFGGMGEEEIARLLDVGVRTVRRDWQLARAWLYREIRR
jgi:RNA polymerase sigma factor (TIGR02999 family)